MFKARFKNDSHFLFLHMIGLEIDQNGNISNKYNNLEWFTSHPIQLFLVAILKMPANLNVLFADY